MTDKRILGKVGNAAKWSTITEILAKLISPITNAILARILVPEAFGAVATITMVISFAEIFTDAGFQKYLVQHEFKDQDDLDKSANVAFWTNFSISLLFFVLICIFRNALAALAGDASLGDGIAVASIAMIIVSFSSIQAARFRRNLDFKALFVSRTVAAVVPLVVTVPLAVLLRSYWALVLGTLCAQLASAIILTIHSKWRPKLWFSWNKLKEMLSFSLWTLLESISIWLTNYVGTFIVGTLLNAYYLGIYKTSMATVNAYMAIITAAITPVLFSALSRLQDNEEEYQHMFFSMQRVVAMLVFPMCVGLFLYRGLVTQILLGAQWNEATNFVGLWSLTSGITIIFSHFNSEVFRSKGKPQISLYVQLLHLVALIPTLYFSARAGFEHLYVWRSLIRFQLIAVSWMFMYRIAHIGLLQVMKNVFPYAASSLCMTAVALLLQRVGSSVIWQFVSIAICAIAYFAVLLGTFPKVRSEFFAFPFVKKLIGNVRK